VAAQLGGGGQRQRGDAGLCRRIVALSDAALQPPSGAGVDDARVDRGTQLGVAAPVLRRVPQHCEVALQVYANDGVPVGFAGVGQLAAADEAGVVDQYVEAAEGVHRGLDEAACSVPVRDVVPIDDRLPARRSDLVDHLVGRALCDVVDHQVRTFGGESQR